MCSFLLEHNTDRLSQEKEGKELRAKRQKVHRTKRMRKLKEDDPERYAEILQRERDRRQTRDRKIKFDEPQPCPHCAKMFELKYAMQVSVCKVRGRVCGDKVNGTIRHSAQTRVNDCKLDFDQF